jgi:hypothetical protein
MTLKNPQYKINTQQRHALRALLLCQRVYFYDSWAQFANKPYDFLPPNRKSVSLNYWDQKTEVQIIEGIQAFIIIFMQIRVNVGLDTDSFHRARQMENY